MMKKSKVYQLALFGDPVNHSLSPIIHQQFASQYDLKIDYELIQIDEGRFPLAVEEFFDNRGHGANVTLPHKLSAANIAYKISEIAKKAKAVNTFSKNSQSQIIGDNTDGIGFINDLINRCKFSCEHKNILILGAGGATQGIVPSIMQQNPKNLVVANRTLNKATDICSYANSKGMTFEHLEQLDKAFDLIIHSSSLGHQGKTLTFNPQHKHSHTICYDLSYAKAAQAFIEFSQSIGITHAFDGLGMLVEQAASAFEIWFGVMPETKNIKLN